MSTIVTTAKTWPAALLKSCRPQQWPKNMLVFAAPGAAGVLDDRTVLLKTLIAFVSFCLASSAVYLWNDLADLEADRQHPVKRHRPILSTRTVLRLH